MKHATQLAFASVAAFTLSAQASETGSFYIDFDAYTTDASPTTYTASAGTWSATDPSDASVVATKSGSDKCLALDTASDNKLTFEPNDDGITTVSLDVKFVGSASDIVQPTGTQAALYLRKGDTNKLKVSVNGSAFADFTDDGSQTLPSISEDNWYKVSITFDYAGEKTVVVLTDGNNYYTNTVNSVKNDASEVTAIDFVGSGYIDNFVGSSETIVPMDNDVAEHTLYTSFSATKGADTLKFITVTDINGKTCTLRCPNTNSQEFDTSKLGSITKVVAHYGDVTATTGYTPAVTSTSVAANGTVTGSVVAKSGLYYAKVEDGVKTALNNDAPIAPEHEGDPLEFRVSPSNDNNYGVKKFKIVASDDPVSAQ